ncbi:MAG: thioredoxin domain-containing protein [bacterium]|nr:thioredoxin domain-containing protein [bacterium]
MQKAKFKIHGMHCQSCATLIEEKLKDLEGIIKSKINYDSGKGVIIYNEEKLNESAIQETIKNVGDYAVEKIEDTEEEKDVKKENSHPNFLIPASIIIAGLIIAGAIIISSGNVNIGKEIATTGEIAQNLPSNNPQPSPPDQASIAQFEITKTDHIRGDFNAPITLVEFSCFECPFSVRHYPTLNKILNDYSGKMRLVYKHFPLGFHPNAQKAAEASECADEQGKFWEYHDKLFENLAGGYSLDNFKQWAKDLGLDSKKFNDCLDSGKFAQKVQADFQEGTEKGVNGTPTTFVNGQFVSGALPYESFKQIIDSLLTRAQ